MKDLKQALNENILNEAAPKSLIKLRKGNTLYVMPKGERKAVPVKIIDINRVPMGRGYEGSYYLNVTLSDNPYVTNFTRHIFKSIDYDDELYQVELYGFDNGKYYIGTSKEAIDQFTKKNASNRIDGVLDRISKLEKELDELYKTKAEMEQDLNIEVFESNLNE